MSSAVNRLIQQDKSYNINFFSNIRDRSGHHQSILQYCTSSSVLSGLTIYIFVISPAGGRNCRPKRVAYVRNKRVLELYVLYTVHCDTIV